MSDSIELKVLTFNLWGIFNSRVKEQRMKHFASKIKHYDIILLQEQFTEEDFDLIMRHTPQDVRETRYFRRFPSSFYGSGCAVISKFPIKSAFFYVYPLQGYPEMFLHGDFFANKGAALVKVEVPFASSDGVMETRVIHLYTTHLVAIYQKVTELRSWRDERYLPFRISQAISLADFISNTSNPSDTVIIGGDFNSSQRSLEVQTLLILLKRRGYSMRSVLPTPRPPSELDSTEFNPYTFSETNHFNSMKTSYFKLLKMGSDLPAQIDHILFNNNQLSLQSYEDCPDVENNYPFYVKVEDNLVPSGVVVFTKNEVPVQRTKTLFERAAIQLRQLASTKGGGVADALHKAANWLSPPSQSVSTNDTVRLPLSDHYGVAAKLSLLKDAPAQSGEVAVDRSLTDEESAVLNSVIQYLESYSGKLTRQVKLSRYIALLSLTSVILHCWLLKSSYYSQISRTSSALSQLYDIASKQDDSPTPEKSQDDSDSVKKKLQHFAMKFFVVDSNKKKKIVIPHSSFVGLSEMLCGGSGWSNPYVSASFNVLVSLTGLASLGIGMFQRAGNANILREQVKQTKLA
ncbi:Endonuclease/Exonuclease/phosphatase family, putative [Angomonas deanei]|uniref:Endonuclease/Exonuclease/phosphatase family, putative n=1 Tax=Angomonas deanei TaxID=59799 RepID=A0A7G2CBY5_9TRYP|nr:Endonuclease/Exonuclease/phosphatase family, putative [Angomonas deanei]